MIRNLLAVALLFSSLSATAGLTSPTGNQIVGSSAQFEWTLDVPQGWLRIYNGTNKIYDSGRLTSNGTQTVAMPADNSTITVIFYKKIAGSWTSQTSEFTSVPGMTEPPTPSVDIVRVEEQRSTLWIDGPSSGFLDWISPLVATCPDGYTMTGQNAVAEAWRESEGNTGFDYLTSYKANPMPVVISGESVSTSAEGNRITEDIEPVSIADLDTDEDPYVISQTLTLFCLK